MQELEDRRRTPASTAPAAVDRASYYLRPRPVALPRARLFAFPYAGAGAVAYHPWAAALPADIELISLQYPGRGRLKDVPPCLTMEALADECLLTVRALCDVPFYFFGHSMGATVAFEVARHLSRAGIVAPQAVFISARAAPDTPVVTSVRTEDLSDEEFCAYIIRYGGMRREIVESPEMMAFVLPMLRADLRLLDRWRFQPSVPIPTPIIALGGDADASVTESGLSGWRSFTASGFEQHLFAGGHFYLQDHLAEVVAIISRVVRQTQTA